MKPLPGPELGESREEQARNGLVAALFAYLLWGLLPIYFKFVAQVSALEVLAHRVVWAIPFGAIIIFARHQWPEVLRALRDRRTFLFLVLSASLIAVNWFVYILAVQMEQIFQASLGYYINPLFNVVAGVVFFSERLRRNQLIAVVLAAVGVSVLTFSGGSFPWIAIALAISFTVYAVIRKQVRVGGMPGLFIETGVVLPFAAAYLGWLMFNHASAFRGGDLSLDLTLLLAGPFTVVPLLLFALAARRLQLTTVSMMQFIAPSLHFCVGVYYGEALSMAHMICFACIWTAISLFAWDAWRESRRILALRALATS
jgi:chloramphenicol-sensitive protein RarD